MQESSYLPSVPGWTLVGNCTRVLLLCLFIVLATSCRNEREPADPVVGETTKPVGTLTFALPVADWWTAAPFVLPQSRSLFRERGLDLKTLEVNSGLASKNAVIAGTADVGLCAATPLALAAAEREGLVILGTYLHSSSVVGLLRPRATEAAAHLPEPVAIVPSTISEWFLYHYLSTRGQQTLMEQNRLKELHSKPADIPSALKSGSAKSAVIWEPFLTLSAEQGNLVVARDVPEFEVNLYLITRPTVLRQRAAAIAAFRAGVEDSCRYLRQHSQESRHSVESHFGFRTDFLASKWPTINYGVRFDRPQMEAEILRDARIAKALNYIPAVPDISYLFPANIE